MNDRISRYTADIHSYPDLVVPEVRTAADVERARRILKQRLLAKEVLMCEIGSGSGAFLIDQAAAHPDALLLAFELRYKRVVRTAEKAVAKGLSNICVIQGDARLLPELIPPDSLSAIFIHFPDPWRRKRRWHKHQLVTKEFLGVLAQLTKAEGLFSFRTDHRDYFEMVLRTLQDCPDWRIRSAETEGTPTDGTARRIRTEFERLFVSQGVPIGQIYALRNGADS